jgi:protein-arginine kinase activator protein McsA
MPLMLGQFVCVVPFLFRMKSTQCQQNDNQFHNNAIALDPKSMKAICNGCKFQVSGSDQQELENNYQGHAEVFGHAGFCIIDYD